MLKAGKPWGGQPPAYARPKAQHKPLIVLNGTAHRNLVNNALPVGGNASSVFPAVAGSGLSIGGITQNTRYAVEPLGTSVERTIFGLIYPFGALGARVVVSLTTAHGATPFVHIDRTAGGNVRVRQNTTAAFITSTSTYTTAALLSYVLTYDGSTTTLYINGRNEGSSTTAWTGTAPSLFMLGDGNYDFSFSCRHLLAGVYARAVSSDWVEQFYNDPWNAVFEPDVRLFPAYVAGGADFSYTGTGGIVWGGTAPADFTRNYLATGTGGITFSGTAPAESGVSFEATGTGGITFSGTATTAFTRDYLATGTGGITFSGTAPAAEANDYTATGSGGVTFSGTATSAFTQNYLATATGGITFSGTAAAEFNVGAYEHLATGGITFSGTAAAEVSGGDNLPSTGGAERRARARALQLIEEEDQMIVEVLTVLTTMGVIR